MVSAQSRKPLRVIWAVDVSIPEKKIIQRAAAFLRELNRRVPLCVEPAYVLNPNDLRLRASLMREPMTDLRTSTVAMFRRELKGAKVKNLAEPKILVSPSLSRGDVVNTFLQHAKKKFDLVVVSSLSKGALDRLVLGSFTEALIVKSPIPVVVVSRRAQPSAAVGSVLFATDLSAHSRSALDALASTLKASSKTKIVLFHQREMPIQFTSDPFLALPLSEQAIEEETRRVEKLGQAWVVNLKKKGIKAEFIFGEKSLMPSVAILKHAAKVRPWMIAMASQKGTLGRAILGSVTRDVLRHSQSPVWIVHS